MNRPTSALTKLKVGAPEDLTQTEYDALLEYIDDLELTAEHYNNVMDSLPVDYEEMFPEDDG